MIATIKKHTSLLFLFSLLVLQTVSSRWIVAWLNIPDSVSKIVTLASYGLFFVFIVCKLWCDIKARHVDMFSIGYYLFAAYYGVLFLFRFFSGMEVKENLYLSIILFASLALFHLIINNHTGQTAESLKKDICIFCLGLILYRLLYIIFLKRYIYYSPINEIAIGGSIVILLPILVKQLSAFKKNKVWSWLCVLILFSFAAIAATLKSRVTFVITLFAIAITILMTAKEKAVVGKIVGAVSASALLITVLFLLNVGEVRYAIYRETNLWPSTDVVDSPNLPENDSAGENSTVDKSPSVIQQAETQISNSDSMRKGIMKMSLENIRKNPLFGTGDVLFPYEASGQKFNAPAHNFILVTLNSYGLIGLALIVTLFIVMLIQIEFFRFGRGKDNFTRLLLLLTFVTYFGMGMVQASVYDMLIMPLMFVVIAAFALSMKSDYLEERNNQDASEQK